jgi:hypothetical protein
MLSETMGAQLGIPDQTDWTTSDRSHAEGSGLVISELTSESVIAREKSLRG